MIFQYILLRHQFRICLAERDSRMVGMCDPQWAEVITQRPAIWCGLLDMDAGPAGDKAALITETLMGGRPRGAPSGGVEGIRVSETRPGGMAGLAAHAFGARVRIFG